MSNGHDPINLVFGQVARLSTNDDASERSEGVAGFGNRFERSEFGLRHFILDGLGDVVIPPYRGALDRYALIDETQTAYQPPEVAPVRFLDRRLHPHACLFPPHRVETGARLLYREQLRIQRLRIELGCERFLDKGGTRHLTHERQDRTAQRKDATALGYGHRPDSQRNGPLQPVFPRLAFAVCHSIFYTWRFQGRSATGSKMCL